MWGYAEIGTIDTRQVTTTGAIQKQSDLVLWGIHKYVEPNPKLRDKKAMRKPDGRGMVKVRVSNKEMREKVLDNGG